MSLLGRGALSEQQKRNKDSVWFCFKHSWTSLAWSILCVCACAHVCRCTSLSMYICWKDSDVMCLSLLLSISVIKTRSLNLETPFWIDWLTSKPRRSVYLCLPDTGVQISTAVLAFMWELGNWTRVNLFTQQSLLPSEPSISSAWVKYFEDLLVSKLFLKFVCIAAHLFNLLISSSV